MGVNTRIIYDNLWRKGTAMASTPAAEPQHPVSDTQMDTLSMFWRSSNRLTTPTYIPMNLGVGAGAIDFVAILGHNIPVGTTITFEHDDNAGFATPASIPITLNATSIFQFFTSFTEQWVRLKLVKAGGFAVAPQVAAILCGSHLEFNRRFAPEYEISEEDFSAMEFSDSQVLFAQDKETLDIRRYSYQALNTASITGILAMFRECKTIKGFAFCHDYSDPNSNTLWVRNSELNSPVCRNGVWYWEIAIVEIV